MLDLMRILVVEDDKKIASFVVNGLKQSGFAVDHYADGENGLIMAQTIAYDAAVVDLMLPKLDGLSLIQQLNAQGDYSMGIAQYVPGQAGKHFWNGDTPGQWTTTPPAQGLTPPVQGLTPPVLGTGGSGVTAPTPNPVAPPRGIVQPTTKAIPPAVQAKVDALRARKVPEVQITEALKKMGY